MKTPDTDYVDFGFLRCAGEDSDIEDIMKKTFLIMSAS